MASSIAAGLRLTIKNNSTYRQCAGCKRLTALPGTETRCTSCRPPAARQYSRAA
ncbi:hypothetical protein Lfu02_21410 [Longispora fulva]|uniref:Zn finger protein HypA/HybF involved in hydrogenase expression n=1 Tax=Longispora fulva TaxID=619741 RepID=A0A8J7GXI1_9ACTN|nr:hypothetical protein [Longispora fulva]MBG6139846.1 Zn finger protein HypA/HybF involved in hydrogenase expression [Longispora fulva]GIG57769.1 hypothetical protein Lfu02_21410 [Longispora fulva]